MKDTVSDKSVRNDIRLLAVGLLFISMLLYVADIAGKNRGWDAPSGYTHNSSKTSDSRFLPEPFIPEKGVKGRDGPDVWARWYYWKQKPEKRTFWSHFFPWCCYSLHQVFIWATIYHAQKSKSTDMKQKRYSTNLHKFNWVAFVLNVIFHILHLLNTHITYDSLAPDVSIASSLSSVIMLTSFIYILECDNRGVFYGWPKTSSSAKKEGDFGPVYIVKKYHGYFFAWASIYTFWYHPFESTLGHYFGFVHTWILLLQGSLMYTKLHLNKYWRLALELWVVVHSIHMGFQNGGPLMEGTMLWPMFVFGYSFCFICTQIYSFVWWKSLSLSSRLFPLGVWTAVTIWAYSWIPDENGKRWVRMYEVFRFPALMYAFLAMAWVVLGIFIKYRSVGKMKNENLKSNKSKYLFCFLIVYAFFIGTAIYPEYVDLHINFMPLMAVYLTIHTVGACISFIAMDSLFRMESLKNE